MASMVLSRCPFTTLVILLLFCALTGAQDCFNGEIVDGECRCFPGWSGSSCGRCVGRIRLENSSGIIRDHFVGQQYQPNLKCLFFIETDRPASMIHLRFNFFSTECQWDYLHVFEGDSIFSPKIAALTGNIIEPSEELPTVPQPVPMVNTSVSSGDGNFSTSGSGSGSGEMEELPSPYLEPVEISLSSSAPYLLLYFYSDAGTEAAGFEAMYWIDYECVGDCSGNGVCENGSCSCREGWRGELCQLPSCPSECSGNGVCDDSLGQCNCNENFTGLDCSIPVDSPHWEGVEYAISPADTPLSAVARAGHSIVVWRGYMVVYGGYRFPLGDSHSPRGGTESGSSSGSGEGEREGERQLLRYHFASEQWEVVTETSNQLQPEPRYGHTAVVYNDTMYVFGGAKTPAEEITNELWALDLLTLTWTDLSNDSSLNTSSVENYLPIPVRSHSAHVVGSKMVVLFGISSGEQLLISFVQEYDFETDTWSTPNQYGINPRGRMGHSSVHFPEDGLIYVYGGQRDDSSTSQQVLSGDLVAYDPLTHIWSQRTATSRRYLHSAVMYGPLMVVFGGCTSSISDGIEEDCFSNDLLLYNTACDEWFQEEFPGLHGNTSRYGHSAVLDPAGGSMLVFGGFRGTLLHDLLRLDFGNCSVYTTREDCLNGSVLCAWVEGDGGRCVLGGEGREEQVYQCDSDFCLPHRTCGDCAAESMCVWVSSQHRCRINMSGVVADECTDGPASTCGRYSTCGSCRSHGCLGGGNGMQCISEEESGNNTFSAANCTDSPPCSSHSSCGGCVDNNCLWCPSLGQCIPLQAYPFSYIYGQCLGWVNTDIGCSACSTSPNCSTCEGVISCGWCNDPANNGLGVCMEGGFLGEREGGDCGGEWFFDVCPACQCNGHSTCVNESICESCQNNTAGERCEMCEQGYFGSSLHGGNCTSCDCNGYNPVCDLDDGTCDCLDIGVTGDQCTMCDGFNLYVGDANNFCHFPMQVGFVYTFQVTSEFERQSFYTCRPSDDSELKFEFEISENPDDNEVVVQLFLGRRSENLWVLANLTEPITIGGRGSLKRDLDDFNSNTNVSNAQLFSFARPTLQSTRNFTAIFDNSVENSYTNRMWNGDVTLVVFVSNLTNPLQFKITVDQMNLLFLLYFFATFLTCFTILLVAFLSGWYIKKKLHRRALIRQQFVELQRRVRRPFARVKLLVEKKMPPSEAQSACYAAVETCKDNKAAVLTVFMRLPGDEHGRPAPGRTGLCFGSSLIKVKRSKEKSSREKKNGSVPSAVNT